MKKTIIKKARFSKAHILAFGLVFGVIGGIILLNSKAATFTANLYVVASGGSPNCVRSASLVDYTTASANNNVCGPGTGVLGYNTNGWNNACKAASLSNTASGTIIGVKAGLYAKDPSDGALIKDTDCSGGLGAAVNPNASEQGVSTGTTAAWAHYQCADGNTKNVTFSSVGALTFMYTSAHLAVEGSCFDFSTTVQIGQGGATANRREQEIQFIGGPGCQTDENSSDCMHMIGLDIKGAKDVLVKNVNYGPFLQCAKNDPAITAAYRCDPNVSFESKYASQGTAGTCNTNNISGCGGTFANSEQPQTYIHAGDSSVYQNVRVQNVYEHDQNQVFASNLVHSGCFMQDNDLQGLPSNNLVFDHIVCERFEIIGMQNSDSGVTVQNSVFSCPTYQLDNASPAGSWDSCATAQPELTTACRADLSPGCVVSNVLYRYNVFLGSSIGMIYNPPSSTFGTFNNVRVIGNVFAQTPSGCTISGITCDHNAYLNGVTPAGTNPTVLSAGNPFKQTSVATPGHNWSSTLLLDLHPTGMPALPTIPNLGPDYALATDGDGNTRSFPTLAGAYISSVTNSNIYVAQTSAGTSNGSSCLNAHDVTWFNTAANWGTTAGQIGPGTTVHLCGTINTSLSVQASGTSGNPITILFENGAKMSAPVFTKQWWGGGAITIDQKDYITIDGGTNGIIENTANGSSLANQVDSAGVSGANANNLVVKNLTIRNIYVRNVATDLNPLGEGIEDICTRTSGISGFTATNNTIDQAYIGIHGDYGNVSNYYWSGNTITHANWGMNLGDRGAGATTSNINIFNNNVSLFSNWDEPGDSYHHNGFYGWAESGGALSGVNFYGNKIGPDYGAWATSGVFFSGNTSNINVYNNLLVANPSDAPQNGFITLGSNPGNTNFNIDNNTVTGTGSGIGIDVGGQNLFTIKNNIVSNVTTGVFLNQTGGIGQLSANYNLYYGLKTGQEFSDSTTTTGNFYNFAGWQGLGYDLNGKVANPLLDGTNHLSAASPAIGLAANLSGLFTTDKDGTSRPSSGAWDAGVYQYASGTTNPPTPPAPPTNPPSTPVSSIKGDCDGDGHVNLIDLSILLKYYNANYKACDFDSSGRVDLLDLSVLLSNYGT